MVEKVILVDDVSQDDTVEIAQKLGLRVIIHVQNRGYGGNQKTCYLEALKEASSFNFRDSVRRSPRFRRTLREEIARHHVAPLDDSRGAGRLDAALSPSR